MKHHLLTMLILLAAIALYAIGMGGGGSALLAAGAVLDLWFWVRAMRGRRRAAPAMSRAKA
jgi:hypothetical protein